ncbi:MAG: dimethyl sulfoxide reductase anchor subunit [Coriobacteriia bacterium]|jgi:anaerobic dimethyl sulfoxide reductase subunit C (anchor subunit)|nr:dimethyl sulfoxide reductase anchor subunit [Coriobacteriia bacterium]
MGIEWSLVLFTVIAGAGAGLLVFAGLGEFFGASRKVRFMAAIIAIILLIVGGCASVLHLGNPANIMAAAFNLGSFSPISLELIFLGLSAIVAFVYLFVINREGGLSKIIGAIGIVVGIIFMYVSGHGYEVIETRPAWSTPVLSLSYLLTSLTLGGFLFLALQIWFKDEADAIKKTALIVLVVAVLEAIALVLYGLTAPLGNVALVFWCGAVLIGGVIAVLAAWMAYSKASLSMALLGILAVLVGGVTFRIVMWLAGSAYTPDLFELASGSRGLFPF